MDCYHFYVTLVFAGHSLQDQIFEKVGLTLEFDTFEIGGEKSREGEAVKKITEYRDRKRQAKMSSEF